MVSTILPSLNVPCRNLVNDTAAEVEGRDKLGRAEVLKRFSLGRIYVLQKSSLCISLPHPLDECEDHKISLLGLAEFF